MEDPLWRREVRERWRRPWAFLLLGVYAAFLATLARVFYGTLVPQGELHFSKQGLGLGAPLFWHFVSWQICGWIPLGILLGSPAIALERERQSLSEYALAGLSSWQIVRAKWWSLSPFALVLVLAPLPVASLCFPLGGVSPMDFISANVLCVGVALTSCAMGLALSATHRTVSAAYMGAIKKLVTLTLVFLPLFFILPAFPPAILLIVGVLLFLSPLHLLPRINHEVAWLMLRLESEAPQNPGTSPSEDEVPFRLEPMQTAFAHGSALARESMTSQEIARYLNAVEAEQGQLDPAPFRLDTALENFVASNPLARRDVQTQLRSWRRQSVLGESTPLLSLRAFLWLINTFCIIGIFGQVIQLARTSHTFFGLSVLLASIQIALLASNGISRERRGNMLEQLQLSALSPSQLLGAKVISPIVLTTRFWGIPIAVLATTALSFGPVRVGIEWMVAAMLLVLTSLWGTLCSLLFRAVSLATIVTLGGLFAFFVVFPSVFSPLLFAPPLWLQTWWLSPLFALTTASGETKNMVRLLLPLSIINILLWQAALNAWKRNVQSS